MPLRFRLFRKRARRVPHAARRATSTSMRNERSRLLPRTPLRSQFPDLAKKLAAQLRSPLRINIPVLTRVSFARPQSSCAAPACFPLVLAPRTLVRKDPTPLLRRQRGTTPLSYVVRGATPFSSRKKEKTGFIEKGAGSLPASLGLYPLGRGTR